MWEPWTEKTAYLKQNRKHNTLASRNLSWLLRLWPVQVLQKICCHCIVPCLYPKISLRWFMESVGISISVTNASSWTTTRWSRQYLSIICTDEHAVLILKSEVCSGKQLIPDSLIPFLPHILGVSTVYSTWREPYPRIKCQGKIHCIPLPSGVFLILCSILVFAEMCTKER